jgi:hypothetical protein
MDMRLSTNSPLRRYLAWLGLAIFLLVLSLELSQAPALLPYEDFSEYWAAGRLNLRGDDPYDRDLVYRLQRSQDDMVGEGPIMMLNPPWTLTLAMPLGALEARTGQLVWLLTNLCIYLLSAIILWRFYGGPGNLVWLACLLGLGFFPALVSLESGQIVPWVLLGMVGFLDLHKRGQDWGAGACLVLAAIKPHLVFLFGIGILLWAISERRWRLLLGGGLALLTATLIPLSFNPRVVDQYWQFMTTKPPGDGLMPTLGSVLRVLCGPEQKKLQWVPSVLGGLWLLLYFTRNRRAWDWGEQAPLLVLVSVATTAYGGWTFDLAVLLIPMLQLVAAACVSNRTTIVWLALGVHLAIQAYAMAVFVTVPRLTGSPFWWVWLPTAYLILYLLVRALFRAELSALSASPGRKPPSDSVLPAREAGTDGPALPQQYE